MLVEGVQVLELNHQVKRGVQGGRPDSIADPSASLDESANQWLNESPWLDAVGQEMPPAVQLVYNVRRAVEGQIDGAVQAEGEVLFGLAQKKARAIVDEVSGLLPFPESV